MIIRIVVQIQRHSYRSIHSAFGSLRMSDYLRLFTLVLISLLALGCGKSGLEQPLATIRLSERTLVLRGGHPLSPRMTAFASDEGLIVFDTMGTPSQAAAFRRRIEREFERKDFRFVVNTHDHWDHWCGNQVFPEAVVVSHESCPAEMKRPLDADSHPAPRLKDTVAIWKNQLAGMDPESENAADLRDRIASFQSASDELARDFKPAFPTLTFSDRLAINLGGHTLKLYFTGGFEAPDDIIAHVPEEGLVVLGDIFQRGHYYAAFENGIDVPKWLEILEAILAENVKFAVPGHGDPLSREELAEIKKYLKLAWEEAEAAARQAPDYGQKEKPIRPEFVLSSLDPVLIDFEALKAVHADNVEAFRKRILKLEEQKRGK